ncbi:MAG TPA: phosphoribosylglycinamide formyltransferase [Tepidisphaeraceae bacterium]|nr:phosphoribosylglycinamide formyltransferase [Tepidisphaeraceae bacterium]
MPRPPIQLAVLISGSGTTLQNLVDYIDEGRLNANIVAVVASRTGIGGIERAREAGLSCQTVEAAKYFEAEKFSRDVFAICQGAGAELVCLGGWLSLLDIPSSWDGRIMNIHPALLPSFGGKGMYGRRVHQAVLDYGCKVSGCTVHFVDRAFDTGPIILQRTCPVMEDDTPESLAHRVFEEEKIAYPQAVRLFQEGRLRIEGRRVRTINLPD